MGLAWINFAGPVGAPVRVFGAAVVDPSLRPK
jgi:hypothetical protein